MVTSDKDQPLMNLLLSPHTYWLIGFLISDISQASVSESVYLVVLADVRTVKSGKWRPTVFI